MCPIIEGADLTSVSTEFEPYAEQEIIVTVQKSELTEDKKQLRIVTKIDEPAELNGRPYTEFINLIQNDGKQNEIGWSTIKRWLEAVFGKGSPEAEAAPPDTDNLDGHQVRLYLTINEYKPKGWQEGDKLARNNKTKKVLPV